MRYVLPDVVRELVPGGLPGPSALQPVDRLRQVYEAFAAVGIRYAHECPLEAPGLQVIRPPDQVLVVPRHGTCLDLAVTFAGACLVAGLHPWVVIVEPAGHQEAPRHALVVVWAHGDWPGPADRYPLGDGATVVTDRRELVVAGLSPDVDTPGAWLAVDPTAATRSRPEADEADALPEAVTGAVDKLISDDWRWVVAVDVGTGWHDKAVLAPTPGGALPLQPAYDEPERYGQTPLAWTPRWNVVPFQERDELAGLLSWCEQSPLVRGVRIRVLHGVGVGATDCNICGRCCRARCR